MARQSKDIEIGAKFGSWTVLEKVKKPKETFYNCQCVCGTTKLVTKSNLNLGKSTSCNKGKCKSIATTHGMTNTKLYSVWSGIKSRLKNPVGANSCYVGITLYQEWDSFINFYNWAISSGYEDGLTIDRIDSSKGYNPDNCRWTTSLIQSQNRGKHSNKSVDLPKGVYKTKPRKGKVIYAGTGKAPYYWIVIYNGKRSQKHGFTTPEEAYLDRCNFVETNYKGKVILG
jgi:hypothetical protein